MKRIIVTLLVLLVFSSVSCGQKSSETRLEKDEKGYSIVFSESDLKKLKEKKDYGVLGYETAHEDFDSVKECKEFFLKEKYDSYTKERIYSKFYSWIDENGKLELYDFDQVILPILPSDGVLIYEFWYYGGDRWDSYLWREYETPDKQEHGMHMYYSFQVNKEDGVLVDGYDTWDLNIIKEYSMTTDNGRVVEVKESKLGIEVVRYNFESGDKTYKIVRRFYDNDCQGKGSIYVYFTFCDIPIEVEIDTDNCEAVSDEWLINNIGVVSYSEEEEQKIIDAIKK